MDYRKASAVAIQIKEAGINTNAKKVSDCLSKKHLDMIEVFGIKAFLEKMPSMRAELELTQQEQAAIEQSRESAKAYNSHVRELSPTEILEEFHEAAITCNNSDFYKRATSIMWAYRNAVKGQQPALAQAAPTPAAYVEKPAPVAPIAPTIAPTTPAPVVQDNSAMMNNTLDNILKALTAMNNRLVAVESKKGVGRPPKATR